MKHSLILLALAATVSLSACQKDAPPLVVQVIAGPAGASSATGATGYDGEKGDNGKTGDTVIVLPQR